MGSHHDRYKTIGQRDFATAVEHLLETEFKLVGSHRVIRMIVEVDHGIASGILPRDWRPDAWDDPLGDDEDG